MMWGHKRAKPLLKKSAQLVVSPVSLWEISMLIELGRVQIDRPVEDDERWTVDDLSSRALFSEARGVSWTRDPFDRLLVAHAAVRRCAFATGDALILASLPPARVVAL